jgi:XRE family aerobic/anaerobic benzoate catabolism transcriptional regulator
MTRKVLAHEASVSERHLANLETGQGNASVMLLRQLAAALNCTIAELVGEDSSDVARMVADPPVVCAAATKRRYSGARRSLAELFGSGAPDPARTGRIALIGLRGAGKSTLGRMLADDLSIPFVELKPRHRAAGRLRSPGNLHALYGGNCLCVVMNCVRSKKRSPTMRRRSIATGRWPGVPKRRHRHLLTHLLHRLVARRPPKST